MSARIKILAIYLIVVLNGIMLLVFLLNPDMKNWWSPGRYFNKPAVFKPWNLKKSDKILGKTLKSIYRADKQRTGFYPQKLNPLNKKLYFLSKDQINIGIHGASKASPAVNDKYIVTVSDYGLLSVFKNTDEQKQQPIWTYLTYHSDRGMHSTPLLVENTLLFGDYSGVFYSLDLVEKKFNWILNTGEAIGASPNITSKGFILLNVETRDPNGYFVKLNAKTGQIAWMSRYLGDQGHSSPALNKEESVFVAGDNKSNMSGVRVSDGKILWKTPAEGPIKSTPSILNGIAYYISWDGYLYAIDISNGKLVWRKPVDKKIVQSSLALDPEAKVGVIHIGGQGICKFSLKDGENLGCYKTHLYSSAKKSSSIITRSSLGKDKIVWAACEYDYICAINLSKMTLIKKWQVGSGISGKLKVYHGEIFAVTNRGGGLVKLK